MLSSPGPFFQKTGEGEVELEKIYKIYIPSPGQRQGEGVRVIAKHG